MKQALKWLCTALYWAFFVFASLYLGFFVRETVGDSTAAFLVYAVMQILVGLGSYDLYKVVFDTESQD